MCYADPISDFVVKRISLNVLRKNVQSQGKIIRKPGHVKGNVYIDDTFHMCLMDFASFRNRNIVIVDEVIFREKTLHFNGK